MAQLVKNAPVMPETSVRSLGWEDPLEKGKATHSSILAWRIPWAIQSMRSERVGRDFHFHCKAEAQCVKCLVILTISANNAINGNVIIK